MRPATGARLGAAALVIMAAAIGISVTREAMSFDDGGPPMGALCAGAPAIIALVAAGVLWTKADEF